MIKKALIASCFAIGLHSANAQYEIRQNITFGMNYSNLWAKEFDKGDIPVNLTTYEDENNVLVDSVKSNPQATRMDFDTDGTFNYFLGYKLTLDFNQRYSFDIGLILNKKGYTTKMDESHNENTTFENLYGGTNNFPLSGNQYRYHEDYTVYRLEIPFYVKINMNSFLSIYSGMNLSFEMSTTDRYKPLGTRSFTNKLSNNVVVGQYYTDTEYDVDAVLGIDALFNKRISVFAQAEIGLQNIDATRDSGIRFYGFKLGVNYVFHKQ